ncbi:MAG: RHS repeat-associated core domain-containing protein [Planctomycetes bacterium]|nr:RHS repeat-associated core domain-containing protein [Planctomycetota bacterium]
MDTASLPGSPHSARQNAPEIGATALRYQYTAGEAWLSGMTGPTGTYAYTLDGLGRIEAIALNGGVFVTKEHDAQFNQPAWHEHEGVRVEFLRRDSMGRPQDVRLTVPRAMLHPLLTKPSNRAPAPTETGYDPAFVWGTVAGASAYQLELRTPTGNPGALNDAGCYAAPVTTRTEVAGTRLLWNAVGFTPTLGKFYCFRVRARKANGEVGPFSRFMVFRVGGWDNDRRFQVARPSRTDVTASPLVYAPPALRFPILVAPGAFSQPSARPAAANPLAPGTPWPSVPTLVAPLTPNVVFLTQYVYDEMGRVGTMIHPDLDTYANPASRPGRRQAWTFNSLAGHKTVRYGGVTFVADATYHASGQVQTMSIPLVGNGLAVTGRAMGMDRQYDTFGRLLSLVLTEDGQTVRYRATHMEYNEWGLLASLDRNDPGLAGSLQYGYDDRGRLSQFTVNGNATQFLYDGAGNLTGNSALSVGGLTAYGTAGSVPATLTLPALGGVSYDSRNRRSGWTYDSAGRVTGDDRFSYLYNRLDQLAEVREGSWTVAQYLFDAEGNRVREVYDDRVVYTVRGLRGEVVSQETHYPLGRDSRLSSRKDFVYANGQVLAEVQTDTDGSLSANYVFRDRLGNPALALSESERFTPKYTEYAPYGRQMRTELLKGDLAQEFTGHERDESSGLDYMRMRFYNPNAGRFLRPDPKFDFDPVNPTSFNLYAYVRSNPINFTDPDGLEAEGVKVEETTTILSGQSGVVKGDVTVSHGKNYDYANLKFKGSLGPKQMSVSVSVPAGLVDSVILGSQFGGTAGALATALTQDPKKGAAVGLVTGVAAFSGHVVGSAARLFGEWTSGGHTIADFFLQGYDPAEAQPRPDPRPPSEGIPFLGTYTSDTAVAREY